MKIKFLHIFQMIEQLSSKFTYFTIGWRIGNFSGKIVVSGKNVLAIA